jgi:regulator of cell morphogenesis and NO signaling
MMIQEKRIGDIVMENTLAATVFEKYGLDYCCHGNLKLSDACSIKFINPSEILRELNETERTEKENPDPLLHVEEWNVSHLIAYIIANHHHYAKEVIPVISDHLAQCIDSHGTEYPLLAKVQNVFSKIASDLRAHMLKEEKILFPSLILMEDCLEKNQPVGIMPFSAVSNPIEILRYEHEIAGNEILKMREILNDLNPSENDCTRIRLAYNELREFEVDMHRHVFLENYILFPRAEKLERDIAISRGN